MFKTSVAPMVDRTDRHYRAFARSISKTTLLYTEMITTKSIINGDINRILGFNEELEGDVALQIAGSDPKETYEAIKRAEKFNYKEINFNVGCPSDRVSGNEMGAILMAYPNLVKENLLAIREATDKPVTLKYRIGIDGKGILPKDEKQVYTSFEELLNFINIVDEAKLDRHSIHARIAILKGLSPKENRTIPPLTYETVYKIKELFPEKNIEINGGFKTTSHLLEGLKRVDSVMVGRESYDNPMFLREFDKIVGTENGVTRYEVIENLIKYIENIKDHSHNSILRHTHGLFHGVQGAKLWKRHLQENMREDGVKILKRALEIMPKESLY